MSAARLRLWWLGGCLAAAASSGCDWRDFDDLSAHTPVLAVGAPSNYAAPGDFGRVVLPLTWPAAGAVGGRYLVSAVTVPAVAVIALDAQGNAKGEGVPASVLMTGNDGFPITSLAEIPGTETILMGAPQAKLVGAVYVLTLGTPPAITSFDAPANDERFGLGVAAAQLAGADAPELVVVSGRQLTVYLDGVPRSPVAAVVPAPDTCPLLLATDVQGRDRLNRGLAIGDLMGTGQKQIVVGTPSASQPGAVSLFTVDAATGVATCAVTFRSPEPRFGQALTTGDFNADGKLDLLVGAPKTSAYLFVGPLTAGTTPVKLDDPSSGGAFGFAVAAANLDGVAGDEALIADPDAAVGDQLLAGAVSLWRGPALANKFATLSRHDPASGDIYGGSVNGLRFCTAGCRTPAAKVRNLPLIGTTSKTFTYFLLGSDDPRLPH